MREIKFRAWCSLAQKMYYTGEKSDIVFYFDNSGIAAEEAVQIQGEQCESYRLDHLKFMQYTGLKDKNGKEIYEGDIIRSVFGTTNHVVFYGDTGFYQIRNCRTKGTSTLGGNNEVSEVIGNIYDNPELIQSA